MVVYVPNISMPHMGLSLLICISENKFILTSPDLTVDTFFQQISIIHHLRRSLFAMLAGEIGLSRNTTLCIKLEMTGSDDLMNIMHIE